MSATVHNSYTPEVIGASFLDTWQQMLDLVAQLMKMRAALITRRDAEDLEIFLSSRGEGNPFRAGKHEPLVGPSRYCEWVIQEQRPLVVPDARIDPVWKHGIGAAAGFVAYVGLPIRTPEGQSFGTICVLDTKAHPYSETEMALLTRFRDLAEAHLAVVYERERAAQRERDLDRLTQLLPICTFCKSVENDDGIWVSVENYLDDRVRDRLTHGMCPRCYEAKMAPYRKEKALA